MRGVAWERPVQHEEDSQNTMAFTLQSTLRCRSGLWLTVLGPDVLELMGLGH